MPHKKKNAFHRNAQRSTADYYENPPSVTKGKRNRGTDDDSPKSFLRLIQKKSRKDLIAEGKLEAKKESVIKIEPGESLGDFKRRVDKEIPIRMGPLNREKPSKKPKLKSKIDGDNEGVEKKKRLRRKKQRSPSPDPFGHLVKDVPFNQPVQAPPTLTAPSRTVKSSLPNSLSAARRDILEAERQDVIAKYRQRMGRTQN